MVQRLHGYYIIVNPKGVNFTLAGTTYSAASGLQPDILCRGDTITV